MKPLLPSLRERKRYVAYEIVSERPINDVKKVSKVFWTYFLSFLGELECSKAGIWILEDKYNKMNQRGLIKVNYKFVEKLKASLALVEDIEEQRVMIVPKGVSGTIKKAEGKYIAG